MGSRTEQLQDMAWECRIFANATTNETARKGLLEVAEQFERLAWQFRHSGFRTLTRLKPEC